MSLSLSRSVIRHSRLERIVAIHKKIFDVKNVTNTKAKVGFAVHLEQKAGGVGFDVPLELKAGESRVCCTTGDKGC